MAKEYIIYCIYKNGRPFYLNTYDSVEKAKIHLYEMIDLEKERKRPYFVDNDFYNNEYSSNVLGKYFCIKEREVTEFKVYSEFKNQEKNNNIIYFKNFI